MTNPPQSSSPRGSDAPDSVLEPIAIVGLGGLFPGSRDVPSYWENIVGRKDSITEVPADRWDWRLYYDPDPAAADKTYSKIGGFVRDFQFDPLKLRIPPHVAAQMDPVQKLAVAATAEALRDAGLDRKPYDPERTAVILGNSMGGPKKDLTDLRVYSALFEQQLSASPAFAKLPAQTRRSLLADMSSGVKGGLTSITEDTMPGELSNVIAGRVANVFNLNGANFTVDAACASSLAAIGQAVNGLRFGEYDTVLCGGVDQMMSPPAYVKFCKIGALSPDGSRPFDAEANGFVMGEGAGVMVLKRLSDALKDGHRIYALVRAVGSSSDGRGKGITAPNPKGQKLAMERCFSQLDYGPEDVGLLEAHGTATKVGDVVEANVAAELFGRAKRRSIGLGSVKSQIGHLKAAAGIAALVKTALALKHRTLPPSINFRTPNPGVDWEKSPFFIVTEAREWTAGPRRANVSSFGFGGTNFHVALEEASPETVARWEKSASAIKARPATAPPPSILDLHPSLGGEALIVRGATPDAVFDRLEALSSRLPADDAPLGALAREAAAHAGEEFCLAFPAEPGAKAREKADFILKNRRPDIWESPPPLFKTKGIYPGRRKAHGKIGFLFPGQGSQYVDMLKDLREKYQVVADTFAEADSVMEPLIGETLTDILFTKGGETAERIAAMEERIKQTEITQPAVLTADVAILRLLETYGLKPDVVCGHSLGEYGALVAAGVLTFKDALLAVSARGKEMAGVKVKDNGKMASVAAPLERVEAVLKEIDGYVVAANKNCPSQTVIAGETKAVEAAVKRFGSLGLQAQEIRVSHAFHSQIVAPAQESYARFLDRIPLGAPRIPVLSNVTAAYYPDDRAGIKRLMVEQIASPVEFIRQVERMRADGVRLFVEVGPKRVLTAFVTSTLEGRKDCAALSSNHPKRGGILEFNDLLARLAAESVDLRLADKDPLASDHFTPSYRAWLASRATGADLPRPRVQLGGPEARPGFELYSGPVVVSGIAAGLPGTWDRLFREHGMDSLIAGQNLIEPLPAEELRKQVEKNLERVVKSETGAHAFERLQSVEQVMRLAGRAGVFDMASEFGVRASVSSLMDVTARMGLASALLALKDAGIPLVHHYKKTTTGSMIPSSWGLPEALQEGTGVIMGSAFPGIDSLLEDLTRHFAAKTATGDGASEYRFSRSFLFRMLSLGHAQTAQFIKAKGPCTQVNAACASTTQAIGIAEDWIRLGRAKRVVIVAADDVTNPTMLEWVGTGFLASGATSTHNVVSEAALPFDRRRNGMIIGMGAVGLVLEDGREVARRGMKPLAELLAAEFDNAAYHVTRLNSEHTCRAMERLMRKAEARHGISRKAIAGKTLFMSHETYTPAQGGSSSAEVKALKHVFKEDTPKVVVTNTKGFTGHAMGASMEDVIAIRAMNLGKLPPIANYKEPDPELAGITLSKGGDYDCEYALRLSAGFGSQSAMTLCRRAWRVSEPRVHDPRTHLAWLREVSREPDPELEVVQNTLRVKDNGAKRAAVKEPPAAAPPPPTQLPMDGGGARPPGSTARAVGGDAQVTREIAALVSDKTGYPPEMLELDLDMEADLGIDTVKQAELFGIIREKYGIARQENLSLKDYPTLRHVIRFVTGGRPAQTVATPGANAIPDGRQGRSGSALDPAPSADGRFGAWKVEAYPRPAKGSVPPLPKDRAVVILASEAQTAKPFAAAVEKAGGLAVTVKPAEWPGAAEAEAELRKALKGRKALAILDLAALELPDLEKTSPADFELCYKRTARALFLTAQCLRPDIVEAGPRAWLLAVTRMGGAHGWRAKEPLQPLSGALTGLSKALSREFDKAAVRAVDFDAQASLAEMAALALSELGSEDPRREVGYMKGVRHALRLKRHKIGGGAERAGKDSVFLITGGGGALAAVLSREIARRWRARIALLDLLPLPPQAKDWAALGEDGLKALKAGMWEEMRRDPSRKATPLMLEKEFGRILYAVRTHRLIEELTRAGAHVLYLAGDLTDPGGTSKAVKAALEGFGRIDFVIHTAGLEESKLLADKKVENYDRVVRPKAHGAFHLLRALPRAAGQRWAFFSSVVARFGNIGQTDYATANDFLVKLASRMNAQGRSAVAFDLTAFADVGMATRGGVQDFLKSLGVDFMPPMTGLGMILDELASGGGEAELVLAGALGGMDSEGLMEAEPAAGGSPQPPERQNGHKEEGPPLYDRALARDPSCLVLEKTFSLETDPWLKDHSIGGVPYVAGVMGLELFAETVAEALGKVPAGFEDVKFSLPIKLLRNKPVSVRTFCRKDGSLHIESDFFTPQGIKLGGPRTHFQAKVLANGGGKEPEVDVPADAGPLRVTADAIYQAFFHGPSFQVLKGVARLSEDGLVALTTRPSRPLWPKARALAFHPMLIEAAFQACGYRDLHFAKRMTLPDSIGRVRVFSRGPEPESLRVLVRHKGTDTDGRSVYDAWVLDAQKRVWAVLEDYKMVPVS